MTWSTTNRGRFSLHHVRKSVDGAEVLLVVALADMPGLEEAVKFGAENLLGHGERVSVLFVPDQAAAGSDAIGPGSGHRVELAVQGVLDRADKGDVPVDVKILAPGQPGQALGAPLAPLWLAFAHHKSQDCCKC